MASRCRLVRRHWQPADSATKGIGYPRDGLVAILGGASSAGPNGTRQGCGCVSLSAEEEERRRPGRQQIVTAIGRQFEAIKQMTERSGPIYRTARLGVSGGAA